MKFKKLNRIIKSTRFVYILAIILVISFTLVFRLKAAEEPKINLQNRTFTTAQIKQFDGTDPNRPTYLGYEGWVYDVSAGRNDFYAPGKPYHDLAGRDATVELNIAGGTIIQQKYPVIGKLVN